jgi:hypothetical protein
MADDFQQHKDELREVCAKAIREYLGTTRGAYMFGAAVDVYAAMKQKNTIVIKSGGGEFFFIKVQKSQWSKNG